MEKEGKRYLYVIARCSNWDGLNQDIVFATRNKKEAIRRFRWIYNEWLRRDFINDEGEEWGEHNITLDEANLETQGGYCYWYDDDGECQYALRAIRTDVFFGWREPNMAQEQDYRNYIEERGQ